MLITASHMRKRTGSHLLAHCCSQVGTAPLAMYTSEVGLALRLCLLLTSAPSEIRMPCCTPSPKGVGAWFAVCGGEISWGWPTAQQRGERCVF